MRLNTRTNRRRIKKVLPLIPYLIPIIIVTLPILIQSNTSVTGYTKEACFKDHQFIEPNYNIEMHCSQYE